MKANRNPTLRQLLRRLRNHMPSEDDPRCERDSYWRLRCLGYAHAHAIRAFRSDPPKITEHEVAATTDVSTYGCGPEDLLFPPGFRVKKIEVPYIRPLLTSDAIPSLESRQSEYTVWDSKISGFGVRVRASGCKSYILLCRDPSKKKLKKTTIGNVESIDLDVARAAAQKILSG